MKHILTIIAIAAFITAAIVLRPLALEYISESRRAGAPESFSYTAEPGYTYTFLEFGSTSCGECRKMAEVMEEIRKMRGDINVVFVNTMLEENQEITGHFGIVTIPSQIILDSTSSEIFRHSGAISAGELLARMPQ